MTTNFEQFDLCQGGVEVGARHSVVTVDFEAFAPHTVDRWCDAMLGWADAARRKGIRSSFFIAVEDIARLRAHDSRGYRRFLQAAAELVATGTTFYPHNHCVFDRQTGARLSEPTGFPDRVPGYRQRASMFYDVVYRHGRDLGEHLNVVLDVYGKFLADISAPRPSSPVFRAGGWDHGSTAKDVALYVKALGAVGFAFDSSATAGAFGSRSWRVGAPFGQNVFLLAEDLIEVAPCWPVNYASGRGARNLASVTRGMLRNRNAWTRRRGKGVFVTVLHFNDFVDPYPGHDRMLTRISTMLAYLSRVETALGLSNSRFDELHSRRFRVSDCQSIEDDHLHDGASPLA